MRLDLSSFLIFLYDMDSEKDSIIRVICFKAIRIITKSPFADCLAIGFFLYCFSKNEFILGLLNTDTSTMQTWGIGFIAISGLIILLTIHPCTRTTIIKTLISRPPLR